jgi:3-carboxy-cis,cis-muconate cycloisomerase
MSLYTEIFQFSEADELFSEKMTLQFLLQAEAALAGAQASEGIIPAQAAVSIAKYCFVEWLDVVQLKNDIKLGGNAAIPLVKQLTQLVKNHDAEAAKYVHLGATSQDIVDTATVLQIQAFLEWLELQLATLTSQLIDLTRQYRNTLMMGRTLLQQAKPITFGLKTAGWLESIARSVERIKEVKKRVLKVQLAGAVGSGNGYISPAVQQTFAKILDLHPANSWHTQRDSLVEYAAVLGVLTGSLAKIAKDVSLLMQTEVGEVFEGAALGKGSSSTMPHKRNPVTCAAILANAQRIPHLVAALMSAMPQEHERSAGLWHAEWETLGSIQQLCAGTVDRAIELTSSLEVDVQRMRYNIDLTQGLVFAENISLELAKKIGKNAAQEWVERACAIAVLQKKDLKTTLQQMKIKLSENELDDLFKPENAIGSSIAIIDHILSQFDQHDYKL